MIHSRDSKAYINPTYAAGSVISGPQVRFRTIGLARVFRTTQFCPTQGLMAAFTSFLSSRFGIMGVESMQTSP